MSFLRFEIKAQCDCGKTIEACGGLVRGGEAPVPCSCGFSFTIAAPKERRTRVAIDPMKDEAKVLQVGDADDESDEPEPGPTTH